MIIADTHGLLASVSFAGVFPDEVVEFLRSRGFTEVQTVAERTQELLQTVTDAEFVLLVRKPAELV